MGLPVALLALSLVSSSLAHPAPDLEARSPSNSKGISDHAFSPKNRNSPLAIEAIASLFGWNWDSVSQECSFLGSVGYGYVQGETPSAIHKQHLNNTLSP